MLKLGSRRYNLIAITAVALLYLGAVSVFWVGYSHAALLGFFFFAYLRGFGITAGFHRYFCHGSFRTSRLGQFLLAFLGAGAMAGSPLGWVATHLFHHRYSDQEEDFISPVHRGFWWTQLSLWAYYEHPWKLERVTKFDAFPEIQWLNRNWMLAPLLFACLTYGLGEGLQRFYPEWGTNGLQMLVWGFCLSTLYFYHLIGMVNSWCHLTGNKPFATKDNSRNNFLIGLLAMGEGWHNNHHRFPSSERQGLRWWEVDLSHYVLTLLSWVGLVSDLKQPQPEEISQAAAKNTG